jgi:hypothetical protein
MVRVDMLLVVEEEPGIKISMRNTKWLLADSRHALRLLLFAMAERSGSKNPLAGTPFDPVRTENV